MSPETPPCKVGDRIRLTAPVYDDWPPPGLPAGLEGTVDWIGQWSSELTRQIGVDWDNGRKLMLLASDRFEVIRYTCIRCGADVDGTGEHPEWCDDCAAQRPVEVGDNIYAQTPGQAEAVNRFIERQEP